MAEDCILAIIWDAMNRVRTRRDGIADGVCYDLLSSLVGVYSVAAEKRAVVALVDEWLVDIYKFYVFGTSNLYYFLVVHFVPQTNDFYISVEPFHYVGYLDGIHSFCKVAKI